MNTFDDACEFCDEFIGGTNNSFRVLLPVEQLRTRFIQRSPNFIALAGLGAFTPGYTLVLPKRHLYSMGQLSPSHFQELEILVTSIRKRIEDCFSLKTIICEHGAVDEKKHGSACMTHAHLHIFPVQKDIEAVIKPGQHIKHYINSLSELQKWSNKAYLYYQNLAGKHLVYELLEDSPSQYLRKILAEAHSITDEWDWAVSPRIDNVMKTVTALSTDSLYGPTIQTYNSIAQEYFTKTKSYEQSSGVQEDLILFTSRLGGNLVLDAGAGSCRDTVYLMQQGFKVEAIDLAEKLLRASADFCPNHVKRVMDIRLLAYANNTFDGIWCSAVLLHLDPANVEVSLKEFYRVLKPNGILHLSVKQGAGTQNVVADGPSNMYREFYYYTIEDVRNLVTKMKFNVEHIATKEEADSSNELATWIKCLAVKDTT